MLAGILCLSICSTAMGAYSLIYLLYKVFLRWAETGIPTQSRTSKKAVAACMICFIRSVRNISVAD